MSVGGISLNEPARSLFAITHAALGEWLPPVLPPNAHWAIGAGTVLAAQWNHRMSTDIDVFLPSNASLAALMAKHDPGFVERMAEIGATAANEQPRSIKFQFPAGRVEITAVDAIPPLAPLPAEIDKVPAHRLPNACILAGKLSGRGLRMPMRDVFDVCVAAELDPEALCCAVNHVPEQTRLEIAAQLNAGAEALLEDAREEIEHHDARWSALLVNGPTHMASLLNDLAYANTELSFGDGAATVHAETRSGLAFDNSYAGGKALLEGIYGMGLEPWMLARYGGVGAFLREAKSQLGAPRNDGSGGGMAGGPG